MRIRLAAFVAAFITATPILWTASPAQAAPPQPDRMSITSMARHWHCDILATPGSDWFHGRPPGHGLLVGNRWKGYFHLSWQQVGWEPPRTIVAVCQF